ncbi:cobaltochelatase subunit CobN [Methanohalophilus sp.]|uniref:cobaltochelatase subunit CobN n=1 Tax=Methanohalophilus sp. TaxID=1966352 RepID=UPI00262ED8A3|nr:cobaltochelatase subunit CobN [Methanohalophilus sp.]
MTEFAYVTDSDVPHNIIGNATLGLNVSKYDCIPGGMSIEADIVFVDVSAEANITYLSQEIGNGNISGEIISFTNSSAFLATVSEDVQQNASLYWTWTEENLERLLVYSAHEVAGRVDLSPKPPLRTSILLVVLPNHATILSVEDELEEYGIDIRFANLTAMSMMARDTSLAPYVNAEIDDFDGDIILEYVADSQYDLYKDSLQAAGDRGISVLGIGGFSSAHSYYYNVDDGSEVLKTLFDKYRPGYWRTVLPENLIRMFVYVSNEVDEREDLAPYVKPTMIVPPAAIYHPDAPPCNYEGDSFEHLFTNRTEYNSWYEQSGHYTEGAPWIGIAMYYRDYQEGKLHTEDVMIRMLEEDGYNVIASYVPWGSPINTFYNNSDENHCVDAIISFLFFGATGPADILSQSDVPVLKAVSLSYQTYAEWQANPYGMHGTAITWKLDQPEMDGVIAPIPVEAQFTEDDYTRYPIMDRVDKLVGTAESYADLRNTSPADRRIALIYFNHPPGKQDVGASYLNLFESLDGMLAALENEGYSTQHLNASVLQRMILCEGRNVGTWAPGELEELVDAGLANNSIVLLDVATYEEWFAELPSPIRDEVVATWGEPPGDMMVLERDGNRYIVIPAIKDGNVILTPQPARGWEEDVERLYHDLNIPVPHQYLAFYLWLQHSPAEGGFGADAIVHVGRHGTHEWLPGKMLCLDNTSYSDVLLGDLPNIYPYIMDGGGEGIQAKRRGYATLISHLTPPIAYGGTYGELRDLKYYLMQYERYSQTGSTEGMNKTKEKVIAILGNTTLDEEIGVEINDSNFAESAEEIVEYMEQVASETIPYGTHTFGIALPDSHVSMFLETMHTDLLMNTSCTILGYNYSDVSQGGLGNLENRTDAENTSKWLLGAFFNSSGNDDFRETVSEYFNITIDASLSERLNQTYEELNRTEGLLDPSIEMNSLIHALDGGYVIPGEQGDPVSNPSALPTGCNYYGFNSKKVPDPTTWEIGKDLADDMLVDYYELHGHFPDKMGVSMWSVETLRHNGVVESMVLRLMGAEPSFYYTRSGAFSKVYNDRVTVTPLDELTLTLSNGTVVQRPRIDVVITTSGLYRDTLQYQMRMLDVAVWEISGLNESVEENYVRKHSQEIEQHLLGFNESQKRDLMEYYLQADPGFAGDFPELAAKLSRHRIFGPPPGGYGVGIEKEIEAGGTAWDASNSTEAIGSMYIFRMANLYTSDEGGNVHYLGNYEDIFSENLKGTDVIFNSRSTSLYGVLDNDDFFQYVGGLAVAIEHVSGTSPEIKVVNLRGDPVVEPLEVFLARELRSRALNPLYLEGMMGSGYSGMKEIAEIVDNLWGWQVVSPELVKDYMWNDLYETLVLDRNEIGIKEAFNTQNPYAYQSAVARMLEAVRKDYWDAPEEVVERLVEEYVESVAENGVTCCHHTCGNPLLHEYVHGYISAPTTHVSKQAASDYLQLMETATGMSGSLPSKDNNPSFSGRGEARVITGASGNQTSEVVSVTGAGEENTPASQQSKKGDTYVEGYEMNRETPSSGEGVSSAFSAADVFGTVFILAAAVVIMYGYHRKMK